MRRDLVGLFVSAALLIFASDVVVRGAVVQRLDAAHNSPCRDQPRTLKDLQRAYDAGRLPSAREFTGTWVSIGTFTMVTSDTDIAIDLNCRGLRRGTRFGEVLIATGYSVDIRITGYLHTKGRVISEVAHALTFPSIETGGDENLLYRCRLTKRRTLACLIYVERPQLDLVGGDTFKKTTVKADEMPACEDLYLGC